MINKDRIVPVTATDLISLYSVCAGVSVPVIKIDPSTIDGVFDITEWPSGGAIFASQPVKEIRLAATIGNGQLYFVPDYTFDGVTVDGEALPLAEGSAEVVPDGCSLYRAATDGSTVMYQKLGF